MDFSRWKYRFVSWFSINPTRVSKWRKTGVPTWAKRVRMWESRGAFAWAPKNRKSRVRDAIVDLLAKIGETELWNCSDTPVEGYLRQWRAYHKMPSHQSSAAGRNPLSYKKTSWRGGMNSFTSRVLLPPGGTC